MVDDNRYELSRRKALLGLGTIGVAGAAAGMSTSALFNDEEKFEKNTIQAGTTNLIVEAGVVSANTTNFAGTVDSPDPNGDGLYVDIQDNTADGDLAVGLTVSDMKPGDSFILRYTVNVENNPMYVAAKATNADDAENANPNPEQDTQSGGTNPDTGGDAVGDGTGNDAGDLDNKLEVTFGYDSDRNSLHDNSLENSITPDPNGSFSSATATIASLQSGILYRGRQGEDPGSGEPGGHGDGSALPTRIGGSVGDSNVDREKVTHFVEFALPDTVGNEVMADSFSYDLVWNAEQVRNNADPSNASEVDGMPN